MNLLSKRQRGLLAAALLVPLLIALPAFVFRPSNDRSWISGQRLLPSAELSRDSVTIRNVRNFVYRPDGAAIERYEDRRYDLDKIESVWFILAPFDTIRRGAAHSFLSFGFADSQHVAISVEARREVGEDYSLLKGMLRQFEIMYVIGDERDLIGLRTNIRNDEVYVYPIKTTPAKVRALFVQMLERANQLRREPEFYHTILNNCTTNILDHANQVATRRIPYTRDVLLPGNADKLALELGLIDSPNAIEELRRKYLVNGRARRHADDPLFSLRIRAPEAP